MPAADIPSGSVMTETMLTDWESRYGRTRAQAISDLDDIENARAEINPSLPQSTYADLFARYYGNIDRRAVSEKPRIKTGILAGAVSAFTSAVVAATMILSGALTVGGTTTAPTLVASGTTGFVLKASSSVMFGSGGNASTTIYEATSPLTAGRGTCLYVTDAASTSVRSYYVSWVNGAQATSSASCS